MHRRQREKKKHSLKVVSFPLCNFTVLILTIYVIEHSRDEKAVCVNVSLKEALAHYGGVQGISGPAWALKNNSTRQRTSKLDKQSAVLGTVYHFIDSFKVKVSLIFLLLL